MGLPLSSRIFDSTNFPVSFEKPVFHFPTGAAYLQGTARKSENVTPVHNTFPCSALQIKSSR